MLQCFSTNFTVTCVDSKVLTKKSLQFTWCLGTSSLIPRQRSSSNARLMDATNLSRPKIIWRIITTTFINAMHRWVDSMIRKVWSYNLFNSFQNETTYHPCGKIFKNKKALACHNRRIHCQKKQNREKHDAAFQTRYIQTQHEDQRYHCSYPKCLTRFTCRSSAMRHLRRQHLLDVDGDEYKSCCKSLKMH